MIEVHFHIFAQRNLYIFGVENGSLCICCLEDESTMYLVEGFEKRFNHKNALSFSPTGFSQNCHLRKLPFERDLTTNIHVLYIQTVAISQRSLTNRHTGSRIVP